MAATPSEPAATTETNNAKNHPNDTSMIMKGEMRDVDLATTDIRVAEEGTNATTTLKAPPPQPNSRAASSASVKCVPSYLGSEESSFFQAAKTLLNSGDFETALSTLEEGMETTRSQLAAVLDDGELERLDFHESLAPFHYLYGTTLLYSIEESTDDQQPMTNDFAAPEETGETDARPKDTPTVEDAPEEEEEEEEETREDSIDDMQNAWDHLDVARIILERMLLEANTNNDAAASAKLRQDLAQVLLRQGDSQRHSGILENAVLSYTSCLEHRTYGGEVHTRYTRKVADVQCNLGAVFFHLVVQSNEPSSDGEESVTALLERKQKQDLYRRQGYFYYYECAKTLGGIVAELAGTADIAQFLRSAEALPQFKSTGDDKDGADSAEIHPKLICIQLRQLLGKVRELPVSVTANEQAFACVDILEDVLEIVEEAESAEKGVAEATAMKEEIKALAQSQQQGTECVGFGSTAAAEFTEIASQPVTMLVTKKKKRDVAATADIDGEDAKLPAKEMPSKRTKSSE